jgi:hypothetical protein
MFRTLMAAAFLGGLLTLPTYAAGDAKPNDTTGTKTGGVKAQPKTDNGKMAAAKKKEKEEHHCNLRLMWWQLPKDSPELGLQEENEVVPIGISQMQVNGMIEYHGDAAVQIMRKAPSQQVDKKGKPIMTWLPYAVLPLRNEDTDICAILFDNGKGGASSRLFDFKPSAFPFGSLQIVNLTRGKVACSLDGKVIMAESNRAILSSNSFVERAAPQISLAVMETGGEEHLLFTSRMIMSNTVRSLFFVIERPSEDVDGRYEVTSIVDMNPSLNGGEKPVGDNPPTTPNKPATKGPGEPKAAPKKAS